MNKANVIQCAIDEAKEIMGDGLDIRVVPICGNNGAEKPTIEIRGQGNPVGCTFNPNETISCTSGDQESIHKLAIRMAELCREVILAEGMEGTKGMLWDYPKMKSRLIFRLVNTEWNRKRWERIPHLSICDLSVEFMLDFVQSPDYSINLMIDRNLMHIWRVTEQEMYQQAVQNMHIRYPVRFESIYSVLKEMDGDLSDYDSPETDTANAQTGDSSLVPSMYVLTNVSKVYGAGAMLYPDILKAYADWFHRDLIILPSSIHEVIIIPSDESDRLSGLQEIVSQVNETEVKKEERLSDNVYRYRRDEDCLEMLTGGKIKMGLGLSERGKW